MQRYAFVNDLYYLISKIFNFVNNQQRDLVLIKIIWVYMTHEVILPDRISS